MTNRLKIIDFFEELVREVDLKAERLLKIYAFIHPSNVEVQSNRLENLIAERRNAFIETIQQLKQHNLEYLNNQINEQNFHERDNDKSLFDKYCFILDKYNLKMQHPEFEQSNDVYFGSELNHINETFGYLIVVEDGCLTEQELDFFKEIIYYGNVIDKNSACDIEPEDVDNFYLQMNKRRSSKIFNAKFENVFVKFGLFDNVTQNYIIRTTREELFKVNSISFCNLGFIPTVKQDAIVHFFKNPISNIFIDSEKCARRVDLDSFKQTLQLFVSNINVQHIEVNFNQLHHIDLNYFCEFKNLHHIRFHKLYSIKFFNNKNNSILNEELDLTQAFGQLENIKTVELIGRLFNRSSNYLIGEYINVPIETCLKNSTANFTALVDLDLRFNFIKSINSATFERLENLKKLNLSRNKLVTIQRVYFRNLTNLLELDISSNPTTSIEDGAFSTLVCLIKLDMHHLKLRSLDELTFDGLINLQELNISSLEISTIHHNAFKPIQNVTIMKFDSKLQISNIPLFDRLVNLKCLYVSEPSCIQLKSIAKDIRELHLSNVEKTQLMVVDFTVFFGLNKLTISTKKVNNEEQYDEQSEYFDEDAFRGLSNLQELEIETHNETNIRPIIFRGLDNLRKLKLICLIFHGKFDLLNLTELNLSKCKLSLLESISFSRLVNLQLLNLESNELNRINSHSFAGLTNLIRLNLKSNQIAVLDDNAFIGLSSLHSLDISKNKLTTIEQNMFQHLINLCELNLTNNLIAFIQFGRVFTLTNKRKSTETLNGLEKLTKLDLSINKLESLKGHQFNGLTNLRYLNLQDNRISKIDQDAFDGLDNLKRLCLSQNHIGELDVSTFKNLGNLIHLELGHNQIKIIQSNTFNSLVNLRRLSLFNNIIEFIQNNSFDKLVKLTELNLRVNQLVDIDCELFKSLEMIEKLFIDLHLATHKTLKNTEILKELKYLILDEYQHLFNISNTI